MSLPLQVIILNEFRTRRFKGLEFLRAKKNPGIRGWDGEEYKIRFILLYSGAKYLSGIGDQTLNTTKGLKVVLRYSNYRYGMFNFKPNICEHL